MERVIKFRGKRLKDGKWIYGHLANYSVSHPLRIDQVVIFENMASFATDNFVFVVDDCEVDPSTVGQFTGLLDDNGKEIYEEDILMCVGQRADNKNRVYFREVLFRDGCFRMVSTEYGLSSPLSYHMVNDRVNWEVVGNVHDNIDLLKGGNQ